MKIFCYLILRSLLILMLILDSIFRFFRLIKPAPKPAPTPAPKPAPKPAPTPPAMPTNLSFVTWEEFQDHLFKEERWDLLDYLSSFTPEELANYKKRFK